jgi:phosphoribosylformimino-5-aminoimidazole carboxamide ribotide isomerase
MLRREQVMWLVLTDVTRDGTLSSISEFQCRAIEQMAGHGFRVVSAGGVTTLGDIQVLKEAGAAAVIIGKALAEERLQLADCINVAKG